MPEPFFTVGIPTFNRSDYLQHAIRGALQQSHRDFELLILDNASTDATQSVVASFTDPRIRYIRQPKNVGPLKNFQDVVQQARGEYLIVHQDDDLLHLRFLERCHAALSARPGAVMFAAPMWMGPAGGSCTSRLLAPRDPSCDGFMASDQVLEFEGAEIATQFLVSIPFNLPAVALHTRTFRETGAFYEEFAYGGDIVTLGRFATFGRVLYDPVIGGYYRLHGANYSTNLKKEDRIRWHELKFHRLIGFFDARQIPWEYVLQRQLSRFSTDDLIHEFGLLARYRAPARLQAVVYNHIRDAWKKSGSRLTRRLLHRVGFRNLVRFAWNQKFGKDLGAGPTLEHLKS